MGEREAGKEVQGAKDGESNIINGGGLTEQVTFEQTPGGSEGGSYGRSKQCEQPVQKAWGRFLPA